MFYNATILNLNILEKYNIICTSLDNATILNLIYKHDVLYLSFVFFKHNKIFIKIFIYYVVHVWPITFVVMSICFNKIDSTFNIFLQ